MPTRASTPRQRRQPTGPSLSAAKPGSSRSSKAPSGTSCCPIRSWRSAVLARPNPSAVRATGSASACSGTTFSRSDRSASSGCRGGKTSTEHCRASATCPGPSSWACLLNTGWFPGCAPASKYGRVSTGTTGSFPTSSWTRSFLSARNGPSPGGHASPWRVRPRHLRISASMRRSLRHRAFRCSTPRAACARSARGPRRVTSGPRSSRPMPSSNTNVSTATRPARPWSSSAARRTSSRSELGQPTPSTSNRPGSPAKVWHQPHLVWIGAEMVKQAGVAAWLIGIAAVIAITAWSGLEAVGHAVASVGWGILLVVVVRGVTVAVAGAGWWLIFPPQTRPRLRTCVLLRFVREATNVLLPMAQVGGDVIGAGLLRLYGVPGSLAAASVIVDVLLQAATQFVFAIVGLLLLIALGADATLAWVAATGLGLGGVMLAGFYLVQRRGGQRILHIIIGRLTGDRHWRVLGTIDAVYQNLAAIYASRSDLLASTVVHMAGWIIGVAEVLIVFACMGHPVSIVEAVVIESLLHAIRGAAFAIPGALGAQEGGLVLLCAAFGIPPEQAIALSLVKRAADLVLGVPGLLGWQRLEWRRLVPSYSLESRQPREPVNPGAQDR